MGHAFFALLLTFMSSPNAVGSSAILQTSNLGLGFFTIDKKHPLQAHYNPVGAPRPEETKVEALTLEAFRKSMSWTELDTAFLTTTTALNQNCVTVHKMVNQQDWFEAALRDEGVRVWIEDQLKVKGDIYLVVGYCVVDRTSILAREEERSPVSTPGEERPAILDKDATMELSQSQSSKSLNRTFEGNIIYAVQYQKLKFGLFMGRKLAHAQIGMDIEWTLMNSSASRKQKPARARSQGLESETRRIEAKDEGRSIMSRAKSFISGP